MKQYRAAAYMRLSVADNKESQSDSIENQESIINYFVDNHPDIILVSRRIDDGYSGVVFERPSFMEMMADIKNDNINCIIVKDLSRFGRDFIETGRYLRKILPAYGVRFIAILDQIDTDRTPAKDDFVLQIKTAINDEYSREISIKTRNALQAMRKNGMYVGACPIYGYRKSDEIRNLLVVDENTAVVVREIFKMKMQGYSAVSIAEILNDLKILSPLEYKRSHGLPHPHCGFAYHSDTKWSASTIFRILKDETYTGALVQGKQFTPNYKIKKQFTKPVDAWVRIENTHKAIISKLDFGIVQRILLLDTRSSPGMKTVNLFSGLLICGCCGGRMTRKTNTCRGKLYVYYYCPAGKKAGCNSPVIIRKEKLIEIVFDQLNAYLDSLNQFIYQLNHMNDTEIKLVLTRKQAVCLEVLHNEMAKAVSLRASLYSSLIKGIINAEDYDGMTTTYSEKIIALEKSMNTLSAEIKSIITHKSEQLRWLKAICSTVCIRGFDRATIIRLAEGIWVKGKTDVEVQFHFEIM